MVQKLKMNLNKANILKITKAFRLPPFSVLDWNFVYCQVGILPNNIEKYLMQFSVIKCDIIS